MELDMLLIVLATVLAMSSTYFVLKTRAKDKAVKELNSLIKKARELNKIHKDDKKIVDKVMGAGSSRSRRETVMKNAEGITNSPLAGGDEKNKKGFASRMGEKLGILGVGGQKLKTSASFQDQDIMGLVSIPSDEVEIVVRGLGSGAYGEVHKGKYKNQPVAVKTIINITEMSMNEFRHEVMLSVQLDHPNLILVLGAMWDDDMIAIVIEFAEGGSLDYAKKRSKGWTWTDPLIKIAQGCARGLAYLHSARYYNDVTREMKDCVLHRDIKPGNILLSETFSAKISDFGHSKALEGYTMSMVGTPMYMSPEVIRGERYGVGADVYSFAMTLWALNLDPDINPFGSLCDDYKKETGHEPQSSQQLLQLVGAGQLRPSFNSYIVKELALLIHDCWNQEDHLRPNIKEVSRRLEGDVYEKLLEDDIRREDIKRKLELYEKNKKKEEEENGKGRSTRQSWESSDPRPEIKLDDDISDCSSEGDDNEFNDR